MTADAARRFAVHAAHEGRGREHTVEGSSFEDAAFAFIETWHPHADSDNEVTVIVTECETGRQHCLRVDLDSGDAAPCD